MFEVMGVLMILMFIATMHKVKQRWNRVARPLQLDESMV
eukprot:SAG22_NODE_952_length_6343_cov_3.567265_3_plen_39_part_00